MKSYLWYDEIFGSASDEILRLAPHGEIKSTIRRRGGFHLRKQISPPKAISPTRRVDLIERTACSAVLSGELSGIRTPDTLLKRQVLCLLS